ncbi:MAG TPA: OmpA family protein [Leptospiraceae bacterium]|nr:OmpA family protein [Leptospiraceae bacterium]HMW08621.1 OmpA family protein [Leptospiraceae bacterium]HMX34577.1 OmpA family protein [Leptospiraceae bacterium]HMY34359.1 OmpA family protein [Leptospiraceae bacterium]HMZ66669.1 OmpA family protein [Leptospiraceae bacterium]
MKRLILIIFLLIFSIENCSEISFRSDPLSLTLVKYENRSSNKYIFLAHEGDDCHLLQHKRIHNFFFFFPVNSFSREELIEISQQKMIRYKNVMRLGDFVWTLFLIPLTFVTYSIEVETCNTGMVAVTRKDPLYQESLRTKTPTEAEENLAKLEKNRRRQNSPIREKSINPNANEQNLDLVKERNNSSEIQESNESKIKENRVINNPSNFSSDLERKKDSEKTKIEPENESRDYKNKFYSEDRKIYPYEQNKSSSYYYSQNQSNHPNEQSSIQRDKNKSHYKESNLLDKSTQTDQITANDSNQSNGKKKKKKGKANGEANPDLPAEEVWDKASVIDETPEPKEPFNPSIYKKDGSLPIIWNYKNSITNRINENIKPFSILFGRNETEITNEESQKLEAFANEYLESYGTSKILLIGHSEWADGKGVKLTLSQLRAEAVRDFLIEKKVPKENILLTFSGGLWSEKNEAKTGKSFSRRVDIVFLY